MSLIFKIVITGPNLNDKIDEIKEYANSESFLNIIATEVLYKRTKEAQVLIWLLKDTNSLITAYYRNSVAVVFLSKGNKFSQDILKYKVIPIINQSKISLLYIINDDKIRDNKTVFENLNEKTKVVYLNSDINCMIDQVVSDIKSKVYDLEILKGYSSAMVKK